MQLDQDTWVEGAYYVDFDSIGQLRVTGPDNHLYFGSAGLSKQQISIDSIEGQKNLLKINGNFLGPKFFLPDPIVGHIRKVRQLVGISSSHKLSFAEILKKDSDEIIPNFISP